jgi:amino-acid N-acetyltransferase
VEENFSGFHVAEIPGGGVVGAIGLEVYGDTGLLRSAVVASSVRGMGIGSRLYDRLISHARDRGIHRLLLLTNTAADYFGKRGFRPIDQKTVTGAVTSSVEFSGACPSHATCMELHL